MNTRPHCSHWLFLRGFAREHIHWNGFIETFAQKFSDSRTHTLDLPGCGDNWQQKSPASIAGMASWAWQNLPQTGSAHNLVAMSLGAMVALEMARQQPQKVARLVLINTSLASFSPIYHRLRPAQYLRILRLMFTHDPVFREQEILNMTTRLLPSANKSNLAQKFAEAARLRPVSLSNAINQLVGAACFRSEPEGPACPVLILNGGGDELVDPRCSHALAEAWRAPLRVRPEAGHDLPLDDPQWVIREIQAWINR